MYDSIGFAVIHLFLLRFVRASKYSSVPHRQLWTLADVVFILLSTVCFTIAPRSLVYPINIVIYLYFWFDALLYQLISVDGGLRNMGASLLNLCGKAVHTQHTKNVFKSNRTFTLFPAFLIISYWSSISVYIYILLTLIVCHPRGSFQLSHGRGLIEDVLRSRYPIIPIGFYPREEHKHLFVRPMCSKFALSNRNTLQGSSVLLLTFESAGSAYFNTLTLNKKMARTPFFDSLFNDHNHTLTSTNHFALTPSIKSAHIALYTGNYTLTNGTKWHTRSFKEADYRTVYMSAMKLELCGVTNVLREAGYDHILDGAGKWGKDSDLLTVGLAQLDELLDDDKHQPLFVHVHSSNTHVPYSIETDLRGALRELCPAEDLQRFINAIEQTDYIFHQLYSHINAKVGANLLTIISSDYGQAFGQQDYWAYGNALIRETINVPLVMHHPKLALSEDFPSIVDFSTHFDILPTTLELLGLHYSRGFSLLDTNRTTHCLLWDGKPSRSSYTCLGLIIDRQTKYKLDLLRDICYESDWNDRHERVLSGEERVYIEALIGALAQHHGIMPHLNANQALLDATLNRLKPRILVVFPSEWDRDMVAGLELKSKYDFIVTSNDELHEFLGTRRQRYFYNVHRSLRKVIDKYRGRIDGVIGTGECPGSIFSSYIGEQFGLCNPSIAEILRIGHKYYSRQFQRTIVPEAVPAFALISSSSMVNPTQLCYPFFIKPVKASMSMLARVVRGDHELREALNCSPYNFIDDLDRYKPLDQLLKHYYGPSAVPSLHFIAEGLLSGQQVTVDGFIQNNQVTIMGISDSIMYPNRNMTFQRFELPSTLPTFIQTRMVNVVTRVIGASSLNHTCFNVELFYDKTNESISIIEINSRMSSQFSDLFYWINGQSLHAVQVQLSLGKHVEWISGGGDYKVAASFVMRRFSDAYVRLTPTDEEIARVRNEYPMINIKILCSKGQRLSQICQDLDSYRYGLINLAAQTLVDLHKAYAFVEATLTFDFEDIP